MARKKIVLSFIVSFILLLIGIFNIHSTASAAFQTGMEGKLNNGTKSILALIPTTKIRTAANIDQSVHIEPSSGLSSSPNSQFSSENQVAEPEDQDSIVLLAKLITLEAPDEPFEGRVAVAAVVLNRTRSGEFPGTIRDVIYQPGQFSTAQKLAQATPDESALKAARAALQGNDPSNGALYFYNPVTCSPKGRRFMEKSQHQVTARIGNHVFLK